MCDVTGATRVWMCTIVAAAGMWGSASWAQNYPVKPVRYVIPFPAGTSNDIVGRLLTDRLTRLWGRQVIDDNPNPGQTTFSDFTSRKLWFVPGFLRDADLLARMSRTP